MNTAANMPKLQFDHGLPVATDAEKSVLGAIMLENSLYHEATDQLDTQDFALDQHRRIFACMGELLEAGRAIDIVTLPSELGARKELQAVGGVAYLCSLTENLPRRVSIADYVGIVAEKALLRRAITILADGITRCADEGETGEQVCASIEASLMSTRSMTRETYSLTEQSETEWAAMENEATGEKSRFFTYGVPRLDMIVGGLALGEMTVLGAAPGQGKTGLVVQLAQRHCSGGTPMLVISPEMTAGQFLRRLWCQVAEVPFGRLMHPERQTISDKANLYHAKNLVATWPLYIDPAYGITAQQAAARARLARMKHGVEIVAIDYLQKLRFASKPSERYIEVGDAAVCFSNLAKHERLALLVLSSITDKTGAGITKTPSLGDLRMSGDIAFEASTVLLLHRPTDDKTSSLMSDGEVIVAKGRSHETGAAPITFNSSFLTIGDREFTSRNQGVQ